MDLSSVQKTLAIIKPDAIEFHMSAIRAAIIRDGFTIVKEESMTLSRDTVGEFYAQHKNHPSYLAICAHLASGPCRVMVVAKQNGLADFLEFAEELKQEYGSDEIADAIHASPTKDDALREIKFFFPQVSVDMIPTDKESRNYVQDNLKPVLIQALTELAKSKPEQPTKWLANYLLDNNPNKPKIN